MFSLRARDDGIKRVLASSAIQDCSSALPTVGRHGAGSFGFHACRGLLATGFDPDAISSDVHVLNIDGPAYELLMTMSKFLVLGMDLNALIAAVTEAPSRVIRRPSLGSLSVGTEGDVTILDFEEGAFEFHDTQGERLDADRRFRLRGMVVRGKWWPGGGE